MVVSSLWEFPDPLLQEIIITNFRKSFFLFSFWFWFLFGVGHWGEKRKREGEKKEEKKKDQKARKGLPHQWSKSFFLLCSSSPLHNFTRSFLLSFLDKREQKRKGSQKNSTRTHAHSFTRTRTARTLSKTTFPFFMEELEPSFGTFKREWNFSLGFCFILCVCVCGASSTFSSFVSREKGKRDG